jgi:uncharacterized membrane protein YdjX (TVP38/TMEM64 family)
LKKPQRRGPQWGKLIAVVVVLAGLAAAWRYTPLSEYITGQRVSGWARAMRDSPWAPFLIVVAYTPAAFVMFPRPLLTLITVIAFGPWLGFTYSMLGIMLAALATFYAGRALPDTTVKQIAGESMGQLTPRLRKHGFLAVLALRMTPVTPFTMDGIVSGAVGIGVWDYSAATFVGMLPGVLAGTVFGKQMAAALDDPSRINYWVLGAVIVVFAAITYGVGRWLGKQQE